MYDLQAKIDYLNQELEQVRKNIENNEIDGCIIINFKKDEWVDIKHFFGTISYFEWLGAIEHAKDVVKDWYDTEEE